MFLAIYHRKNHVNHPVAAASIRKMSNRRTYDRVSNKDQSLYDAVLMRSCLSPNDDSDLTACPWLAERPITIRQMLSIVLSIKAQDAHLAHLLR